MSEKLLELYGVTKRFRGLTAVDQVSFSVSPGEIIGIIGPNGSGKTTTFSCVSGFLVPEEGDILFEGQSIKGHKPSDIALRGVARTFQVVQPFEDLSVVENVVIGALRGGEVALDEARAYAREITDFVGLGPVAEQLAGSLTIPGRKRLEIAKALATRPKLLLLDEVMAGLRPSEVDLAIKLVRAIRDKGITVILVEHLMRAVMALSERLLVLDHGALIAHGDPRSVIADPAVVEAYFGKAHAHA
jgi:branched-chain amino acid transport system ATP-binding protein